MTVEFVVITPLLLVALVFAFEFGRHLWAYDVMSRDIRGGVRYLARATTTLTPPDCPDPAKQFVTNGTDANPHFPWTGTYSITCPNLWTVDTGFNQTVNVVEMQATVTLDDSITSTLFGFLNAVSGGGVPSTLTLTVTDQARLIGN